MDKSRNGCIKSRKKASQHAQAWNDRAENGDQTDFINGVTVDLTEHDCLQMAAIWDEIGLNMQYAEFMETTANIQPRWP